MLFSFLKYNPKFDGDIVVIHDGLPEQHQRRLSRLADIKFVEPDARLRDAIDSLVAQESRLEGIYRRLFSLEVFRLSEYQRVVYMDSDIYCSGDVSELFNASEALLACPDGFTIGDRIRAKLCAPAPAEFSQRYGKTFASSFNAGVMSIGAGILGDASYESLLKSLDADRWKSLGPSKFTDQMILNVFFENRYTELHSKYNYVVFLEEYQKSLERVSLLDARLVHFAGVIKPWLLYDPLELSRKAPQFIKFIDVWRELLDEARSSVQSDDSQAATEKRFERQKNWISKHNQAPMEAIGKIE